MISQIGLMLVLIFVGVNVTNSTNDGCPENYYGGDKTGLYDLLDRWCDDLDEISPPR
jgi:hypothetical protein